MAKLETITLHAIICIAVIGFHQNGAVAADCGDVPEVENAVIIAGRKSIYKTGDTVRYQCSCDSIKAAEANMCVTCSPQGDWDTSKVICKAVCGDVPEVSNTVVIGGIRNKYTPGETVQYQCEAGFVEATDADMNVTCDPQGAWNTSKVTCIRLCGDVPEVSNTVVIGGTRNKYTPGDTVQYQCEAGFDEATDADMNVTCDPQGAWNTSKVTCNTLCGDVPEVSNTVVIGEIRNKYTPGDTVQYQCEAGFVEATDADMNVTCDPQGAWNTSKVTCNTLCGDVPEVSNTVVIGEIRNKYTPGDTVQYQCEAGFVEATDADMNVTCDPQGAWNTSKVTCNTLCGDVPEVSNTVVIGEIRNKYTPGDTVQYQCEAGFVEATDADMNVTCDPQGAWNTSKVTCNRLCGDVPEVSNTVVIGGTRNKYTPGDTVQYQCEPGFVEATDADMNVTCDPQGAWNTSKVTCNRLCGDVPEVSNTVVIGGTRNKYTPGDTVQYQCEPGFVEATDADMNVTCDPQGAWNTSKVTCNRLCGDVPEVPNSVVIGEIRNKYTPGDTVQYQCEPGFVEATDADMNVTCDPQGAWNTSKVTCNTGCRDVPEVSNTVVIGGTRNKYTPGDTVQYQCEPGFVEATDADMNVTCDPQGAWNTSKVTCNTTAKNCWDIKTVQNISEDGVYEITSPGGGIRSVRCDMTTDGGGWTIFQRRGDGSVSFKRTFQEYRGLFGNLSGEFWLGNDVLFEMTHDDVQTLRIDICDRTDETRFAKYDQFSVGPVSDYFRLSVTGYSGTAGDALIITKWGSHHNGKRFSSTNVDQDESGSLHCGKVYNSGWWFTNCVVANLNGLFFTESPWQGIKWTPWMGGAYDTFKGTEMKIRPSSVATASTQKPFRCPVI